MAGKEWNESSTLGLIAAVQRVENEHDPASLNEEDWRQVAAELPPLPSYLGCDVEEIPDICKARFAKISQCFNDLFNKSLRHPCLTRKVMKALAYYSSTLDTDDRFPPNCTYQVQPIPSPYGRYEEPPSPCGHDEEPPRPNGCDKEPPSPYGRFEEPPSTYDEETPHAIRPLSVSADKTFITTRKSPVIIADENCGKGIPNAEDYDEIPHHRNLVSTAANELGNEGRRSHQPEFSEELEEKPRTTGKKERDDDDEVANEGCARVSVHGRTQDLQPTVRSSNLEERTSHPELREVDLGKLPTPKSSNYAERESLPGKQVNLVKPNLKKRTTHSKREVDLGKRPTPSSLNNVKRESLPRKQVNLVKSNLKKRTTHPKREVDLGKPWNDEESESLPRKEIDPYSFKIKLTDYQTTGSLLYILATFVSCSCHKNLET